MTVGFFRERVKREFRTPERNPIDIHIVLVLSDGKTRLIRYASRTLQEYGVCNGSVLRINYKLSQRKDIPSLSAQSSPASSVESHEPKRVRVQDDGATFLETPLDFLDQVLREIETWDVRPPSPLFYV
jgi:hypothetical protein